MKKYFLILGALGLAAGLAVNAQNVGTRQFTSHTSVTDTQAVVSAAVGRIGGVIINSVGTTNVSCYFDSGSTFAQGVSIAAGGSLTFGLTPLAAPADTIYQGQVFCIGPAANVTNTVTSIQILK